MQRPDQFVQGRDRGASGSSDVEENCLTPQLSSVVVRFVLEVKLYAFSLRAMAAFTLFDQVSRACP